MYNNNLNLLHTHTHTLYWHLLGSVVKSVDECDHQQRSHERLVPDSEPSLLFHAAYHQDQDILVMYEAIEVL